MGKTLFESLHTSNYCVMLYPAMGVGSWPMSYNVVTWTPCRVHLETGHLKCGIFSSNNCVLQRCYMGTLQCALEDWTAEVRTV